MLCSSCLSISSPTYTPFLLNVCIASAVAYFTSELTPEQDGLVQYEHQEQREERFPAPRSFRHSGTAGCWPRCRRYRDSHNEASRNGASRNSASRRLETRRNIESCSSILSPAKNENISDSGFTNVNCNGSRRRDTARILLDRSICQILCTYEPNSVPSSSIITPEMSCPCEGTELTINLPKKSSGM